MAIQDNRISGFITLTAGKKMKAIFIGVGNPRLNAFDLMDLRRDEDFHKIMSEYKILESHIIYFSAGDSKIKEILIKKDPTFSA